MAEDEGNGFAAVLPPPAVHMTIRFWMFAALALLPLSTARSSDDRNQPKPGKLLPSAEQTSLQFVAPGDEEPPDEEPLIPPPPKVAPRQVDLSISSIRSVRTNIAAAPAYDARGNLLKDPDDVSDRLLTAQSIAYPSNYGPNWLEYSRFPETAGYCHRPLYFEELNLERYGNSVGWAQPVVSAAQFYGTVLALPYMATVERPWICYAPEPWYPPPGVHAPWQPPKRYPLRLDAAAVEAATVTGLILALP